MLEERFDDALEGDKMTLDAGKLALTTTLVAFMLVYVIGTWADTRREVAMVFEGRLLRRYVMRFSLATLLKLTGLLGLFFAVGKQLGVSSFGWIGFALISLSLIGGAALLVVAYRDLTFKGARRHRRPYGSSHMDPSDRDNGKHE